MSNGIICLTFDDKDVNGWTAAIPLFARYNAHATFSFSGDIDDAAITCMKALQQAGHTIGLHTIHHADAPEYLEQHGAQAYFNNEIKPQLDICQSNGIVTGTFAFPNNKYNDAAIALLSGTFHHFRAGCSKIPESEFVPMADVTTDLHIMRGRGLGEYYHTETADVIAAIDRAADRNECLTFFSHGIAPAAKHVNMPLELLTAILEHAAARGCRLIGFDELPR